jgi:hypothetical protein
MKLPMVVGGTTGGGVAASGRSHFADMSGGGFVTVEYSNIQLRNSTPDNLRYWSNLAGALNKGSRTIVVPLLVDFIQPLSGSQVSDQVSFSDDEFFSDGMGFAGVEVAGGVTAAATEGAGIISVSLIGGTNILYGGEWFSIQHATKSHRAYQITDVLSTAPDGNGNYIYQIAITPQLREDVAGTETVRWERPLCLMTVDPKTPIEAEIELYWHSEPSVRFIEAW